MIKLFGFEWLTKAERLEYKKLKEERYKESEEKVSWQIIEELPQIIPKPYKSLRMINNSAIICVLHDGATLTKMDGNLEMLDNIRKAKDEIEIIGLFVSTPQKEEDNKVVETREERALVASNLGIFAGNYDFIVKEEQVFIKGVENFSLPAIIIASFIEILEKLNICRGYEEEDLMAYYNSLILFTLKLALNPIKSSREDLLRFVKMHDVKLTNRGNLVLYRKANLVQKDNALVDFVSKEYFKVKKWKKSPKNYDVGVKGDSEYKLFKDGEKADDSQGMWRNNGNLEELYLDLPNRMDNLLTDNHTRTKEIRVGEVYKENEGNIDIDSRNACSSGLHAATKNYPYYCGDTGLLVIVSPTKVRSVPYSDEAKMRVSEMFIAAIIDTNEEGGYLDDDVDIVPFDEEYHNLSVEELEEAIKNTSFAPIVCQNQVADVNFKDIESIKNLLKERIQNI